MQDRYTQVMFVVLGYTVARTTSFVAFYSSDSVNRAANLHRGDRTGAYMQPTGGASASQDGHEYAASTEAAQVRALTGFLEVHDLVHGTACVCCGSYV